MPSTQPSSMRHWAAFGSLESTRKRDALERQFFLVGSRSFILPHQFRGRPRPGYRFGSGREAPSLDHPNEPRFEHE
jgi:hypothetical protein